MLSHCLPFSTDYNSLLKEAKNKWQTLVWTRWKQERGSPPLVPCVLGRGPCFHLQGPMGDVTNGRRHSGLFSVLENPDRRLRPAPSPAWLNSGKSPGAGLGVFIVVTLPSGQLTQV